MKYMDMEKLRSRRKRSRMIRRIALFAILSVFAGLFSVYAGRNLFEKKNVVVTGDIINVDKTSERMEYIEETTSNLHARAAGTHKKVETLNKIEEQQLLQDKNRKVAYLTFDDGPSPGVTTRILDVLKEYNIKSTFFVIGNLVERNKDILMREVQEGHVIANHTYSHVYSTIYSSPQNFMSDFFRAEGVLKSLIPGYDTKIMRFPGGSFGSKGNGYKQAVEQAGYRYIDWNALNGDADAARVSVDKQLENIKITSQGKNNIIVLMHDAPAKDTTAEALPKIIEYLKAQGYAFEALK